MKVLSPVRRSALCALRGSLHQLPRPRTIRPICRQNGSLRRIPPVAAYRTFTSSSIYTKGLSPGSSDPAPPSTEAGNNSHSNGVASDLTDGQYHEIADEYLNNLLLKLEQKAETSQDIEVEYSAGVLTLTTPRGTYVINKQPPNKQIWLSSPVSGPKRYDWVMPSSNISQYEKQETEDEDGGGDDGKGGKWIYLRDKSTLTGLLKEEVGVRLKSEEGDEEEGFRVT